MTYSMEQIQQMTAYAADRAIDLIVEIDVPGHAASWTAGKPELMADCFAKYYYNINDFALNPTLDETYDTLRGIVGDVMNATKSKYFHLGGDEVVYGCWKEDASITTFMANNNIQSYDDLLHYFVERADAIVADTGARVIHWEEVFTSGAASAKDTIFQVWTDSSIVSSVTAANYNVIASPSNYWYLNIATNTWQVMYSYDPYQGISSTTQQQLIIGGEVAIWGEYADDMNIQQTIYPRASAVAERLWSPATVIDQDNALIRLRIQRCRLVARGVKSAPVDPGYCAINYV